MRVLFAAGGTAGHINPALAIAQGIQDKWPDCEIHFAGRQKGMESKLVAAAGYPFHPIEVRGIQRSFSPKSMARNMAAAWYLVQSPVAARRILKLVQPDLVIGTGGYVSGPVLQVAAKMKYKTAIHEQNAWPGVTNKLLAKTVDLVLAPAENAVQRLGMPDKTVVVGNPVRPSLFSMDRQAAREKLGAKPGQVVIASFGGSLGAMRINQVVADLAHWHLERRDFLHIHATGAIEKEDFARLAAQLGIAGKENFRILEYIEDMPSLLAACDLAICRAGALSLAELAAVGRASVLIPSPHVAENHQYFNALEFKNAGAAELLEERDLTGAGLISAVDNLTKDPELLAFMGNRAKKLGYPNALGDIVSQLEKLMAGE